MEEVEAAEAKMNAAKDALLNYIEAREAIDRDRHRRLVAQIEKGASGFFESNFAIGRVGTITTSARSPRQSTVTRSRRVVVPGATGYKTIETV